MDRENLIIHKLFEESVSKFLDNVALQRKIDEEWQRWTYKEIEVLSLKVATFLIKEDFKNNDFAALVLENRPEWAIIYLGIMSAGLSCVPLDPQATQSELRNLILDSTAKVIFCSHHIFSKKLLGADIQEHLHKIIVLDAPESNSKDFYKFSEINNIEPDKTILPSTSPEDIASLIYTSGTTAHPKGVLLTHKNICSNFRSIEKLKICSSADNMLAILPLYHTYAFMVTLITPLFLGGKVTFFDLSHKPADMNAIIKEAAVTILVGVPQIFAIIHKTIHNRLKKIPLLFLPFVLPFIKLKLSKVMGRNLRLMLSGGARLDPKIGRDLSRLGFKLIEGYGLTETSPVVTFNPPTKIKFSSVGKPIPDVEIKIFEPDKSGVGEVLIKGDNVFKGYFKRPEQTFEVIKEGWFYSGDLGFIDKEGYLFLTGRKKDVIVLSSGKNIYPEELEEYYGRSPYIKELCILPKLEERFGSKLESLYAIVVPNLEYFRQKNVSDIQGKLRWELENLTKGLPAYQHIMGWTVTKEELPRTPLRKLKRYAVKQKYLEGKTPKIETEKAFLSEEDKRLLNKDVAKKLINYVSRQLNKPVYLDSHLEIDLGIDSLTRVELGLGLESLLSIKIPDEILYNVSTMKEVIMAILSITEKTQISAQKAQIEQRDWQQMLKELPKEEIIKKISIELSFINKLLTWLFKYIFLFIFRVFWLLKIEGDEFLPKQGPYIICPNHASFLDGFVVFSSLGLRESVNIYFLGYSDIFEHPLISWAIKLARLLPIDPAMRLTEAMQAVSYVLIYKKIVCIFPEGRRSIDENVNEFKKGVAILIKELDIPVVPVYIKGSHRSWPRTSRFPRFCRLKIIFGKPKSAKELQATDYEAIAQALREEVIKLADRERKI